MFSLEGIEPEADSEWSLRRADLGARVRRKKDGREFLLGLSELTPVDEDSENFQPLHDYTVWFVNYT